MKITYDERVAKAPAQVENSSGGVATLTRPEDEEVEKKDLLTAAEMAHFVKYGFVRIENLVPDDLNQAVLEDQRRSIGTKFDFWYLSENIRKVFELPQVKGKLQGFVGEAPIYDHSFLHRVRGHKSVAQDWHSDSIPDARPFQFDVQAFYWSHDAPLEMGPTIILPGSHLRKANIDSIGRYKNFMGQLQMPMKAGSITFFHHGLWHCAQPNSTDTDRFVFKLRLRPNREQIRLFNMDGYDSPEVMEILKRGILPTYWQGDFDRLDSVQHARFWRYVTGDSKVDTSFESSLLRMHLD